MSGTHKVRSRRGGSGGGGGGGKSGGDDDDEGGGGPSKAERFEHKAQQRCFGRVKRVSLFRFRKANDKLLHRRRQKGNLLNSQCYGGGGRGWCLCMKQSMTIGSSGESPVSDPNSPEFTFDMLRDLIEKNDFLGKDCNTHLIDVDVDSIPPSSYIDEEL